MLYIKSILLIFALAIITSACHVTVSETNSLAPDPRDIIVRDSGVPLFRDVEEYFHRTDRGGVVRFREDNRSRSYHLLTTDVDDPIIDPTQTVNTDAIREEPSLHYSYRYEGILTKRRITGFQDATFHLYADKDWPRVYALLAVAEGGSTDIEVGGPDVPNYIGGTRPDLPSGRYTYNGTTIITPRNGGAFVHSGRFEMEVDFDQSSGTIRAEVENHGAPRLGDEFDSILTGNFNIDYRNSTYHGDELRLVVNDDPNSFSLDKLASIYGNFHNHRGTGVTGVYFDNSPSPAYGGAIVGARTRY